MYQISKYHGKVGYITPYSAGRDKTRFFAYVYTLQCCNF